MHQSIYVPKKKQDLMQLAKEEASWRGFTFSQIIIALLEMWLESGDTDYKLITKLIKEYPSQDF